MESNDSEKENFNLSLQAKTEPTKVLDQLLIEQFNGETKRADRTTEIV